MFFGTPGIAVPVLEALTASEHEVAAVVTAPDRPRGRGMKLQPSEVKSAASRPGISVLQPTTLKNAQTQDRLRSLQADVFVVVAYGLILPAAVLQMPRLGCVNVHFSLLPRWRGAAPVQWAIIEGDAESGVTVMQMDEGLDTGPVLERFNVAIGPDDTAGTLADRLAELGASVLPEVLSRLEETEATSQPGDGVTYASKLQPADARIDWAQPAEAIRNRIRGLNPRPGAWTMLGDRRLKIWSAEVAQGEAALPGTLVLRDGELQVATGLGRLRLLEVQPEGKSRMSAGEFVRGYHPEDGTVLV